MGSSILSQGEIDALLHTSSSEPLHDGLLDLLTLVAENMITWFESTIGLIEISGPYVERLGQSLEQNVTEDTYMVAVDLGQSQIYTLISALDAGSLANNLEMSPAQAVQLLSNAWVAELSRLLGIDYRLFQVQSVNVESIAELPLENKTILIRHLINYDHGGLEFCLLISGSDVGWLGEQEITEGPTKVNPRRQETSTRRLLKGNQSPVTEAKFSPLDFSSQSANTHSINLLEDIDLLVTVELGQVSLTLNELLELKLQSVIPLDRHAGENVDVYINHNYAAKAEVVVLEENFGVRILEIVPKSQRIPKE